MDSRLFDVLSRPTTTLGLTIALSSIFYWAYYSYTNRISGIPWVGRNDKEWFASRKARHRGMVDPASIHREGYEKYSKNDKPFYFPTEDGCDTVILPPSQVSWLASQPEPILSAMDAMRTLLQTDYMFDPHALLNPVQNFTTRVLLTRRLPVMIPGMVEEMGIALDEFFGTDTENWKEIPIVDTLREVAARISNRAFVGDPLCRNQEYLNNLLILSGAIGMNAAALRNMNPLLRPLRSWWATRDFRNAFKEVAKFTNPVVLQRIQDIKSREKGDLKTKEPMDFLQAMIHQSLAQPYAKDATPNMITLRITLMNFASVQNLSKAGSNTILDLVNAPADQPVLDVLRKELESVMGGSADLTKEHISKMEKLDSVIKESLRISHGATTGFHREVRAPSGVKLWNGQWVPNGTLLGVSAISQHHDDDYYSDALKWQPFRFYEDSHREDPGSIAPDVASVEVSKDVDQAEYIRQKQNSLTATSDTFLTFGHGVHACPGRFYSAVALKVLIMAVLQRYHLRPQTERSENIWESGAYIPSSSAVVEVMRKK
ncbi:MAG: hypothetical protein M4579_003203 [Chaenotheca gracillima]|nr:MAG: hypothetical protein M4579_003203 [Chaenotheca gracillima]